MHHKHHHLIIATYALLVLTAPLIWAQGANAQVAGCPLGYICTPIQNTGTTNTSSAFTNVNSSFVAPGTAALGLACHTFTHDLTIGSQGTEVTQLQQFLNSQGYSVPTTGYFGSLTSAALGRYQLANGLSEDGFLGPITRARIDTLLCSTTAPGQGTACTMDVMTCSDGSTVSRDPANSCQFRACPVSTGVSPYHSADTNRDWRISSAELASFQTLYEYRTGTVRTGDYSVSQVCTASIPGSCSYSYIPGPGGHAGPTHSADTNRDWRISLTELTRVIELFNANGGYRQQAGTEDGFAPIVSTTSTGPGGPIVSAISPVIVSSATQIAITGSNLSGASSLEFRNLAGTFVGSIPATALSANYVTATISGVFIANTPGGIYQVSVVTNNCPGGCNSNRVPFTIAPNSTSIPATASVDLKANGTDSVGVVNNSTVHLTWTSSGTTYCQASGSMLNLVGGGTWGNNGRLSSNGSADVIAYTNGTLPSNLSLGLQCFRSDGTSVTDTSVVTVNSSNTTTTPAPAALGASCTGVPSTTSSRIAWSTQVSGGTAPYSYSWSAYGDVSGYPEGSTQSSMFAATYSTVGTKQAVVRVTDSRGAFATASCSATAMQSTTGTTPTQPVLSSISPSSAIPPLIATLFGSNLSGASSVVVTTAAGVPAMTASTNNVTATSLNFMIPSLAAGLYQVRVVTNNCPGGCDSNRINFTALSQTTTVTTPPTTEFSVSSTAGTVGSPVTLTSVTRSPAGSLRTAAIDQSSDNVNWTAGAPCGYWTNTSNTDNTQHTITCSFTPATAGTYYFRSRGTDSVGSSNFVYRTVTVSAAPAVPITASITTTASSCVLPGTTMYFSVNIAGDGITSKSLMKDTNADGVYGEAASWGTGPGTHYYTSAEASTYSGTYSLKVMVNGVERARKDIRVNYDCGPITPTYQACGGTRPSTDGVVLGNGNYQTGYGTTQWTFVSNSTPAACQWTCASGYGLSGNGCAVPTTNTSPSSSFFLPQNCGGNEPTANAYTTKGNGSYQTGYATTQWTFVTGTPAACQYTCTNGGMYNGSGCSAPAPVSISTPTLSTTSWYADDSSTWPTVSEAASLTAGQAMRVKGLTGEQYFDRQDGVRSGRLTSSPAAGTTQLELYVYDYNTGTKIANGAVNVTVTNKPQ